MLTRDGSPFMKIYIRLYNGNGCTVNTPKHSTFNQLIQRINRIDLQLPASYLVLFRGKHIKEYSLSLTQLQIQQNSILHIEQSVHLRPRSVNMDVCICCEGEVFVIKSSLFDKIKHLKQTIFSLMRIQPKYQLIVFNGKILKNKNTLAHYNVLPNSLICLISTWKKSTNEGTEDGDSLGDGIIDKENRLIQSVISMREQRTECYKNALFRSDNKGKKNLETLGPIQITIKRKSIDQNSSVSDFKQFNFDLFKSFTVNPMTLSTDNHEMFICNLKQKAQERKQIVLQEEQFSSFEFNGEEADEIMRIQTF